MAVAVLGRELLRVMKNQMNIEVSARVYVYFCLIRLQECWMPTIERRSLFIVYCKILTSFAFNTCLERADICLLYLIDLFCFQMTYYLSRSRRNQQNDVCLFNT